MNVPAPYHPHAWADALDHEACVVEGCDAARPRRLPPIPPGYLDREDAPGLQRAA